jgi:hypothetical protein
MSASKDPAIGTIAWTDLTVEDAPGIRDFYTEVVGWRPEPVPMGEYEDFTMVPPGGEGAVGICHARGGNAGLPAQWMIYILVADLDASMASCKRLGGEVIAGPKSMGASRYCVVKDPAGAVAALFQKGDD